MCVLIFSTNLPEIFLILVNSEVRVIWCILNHYFEFFLPRCDSLQWGRASSLSTIHDHTQSRHTR
jgi:hypothetical protein